MSRFPVGISDTSVRGYIRTTKRFGERARVIFFKLMDMISAARDIDHFGTDSNTSRIRVAVLLPVRSQLLF